MTTPADPSPEPTTEQPVTNPSKSDKPGGFPNGTIWQLGALLLAALGVWTLVSLRDWHETFAASDAWAHVVLKKQLDGSVLVAAAAHETTGDFPSEAALRRALFTRLGDPTSDAVNKAGGDDLVAYHELVRRRSAVAKALRGQTTVADNSLQARLERLASNIELTFPKDEREASKEQTDQRAAVQRELTALNQQRQATVAVLKQMLADLDGQIDAARDGWDTAFEAALSAARPVDGFWSRLSPWLAVRLGDEASAWHLLYVLFWYAIEGLAALMLCIAVVPWILRLAGSNATATELVGKLKDLIANLFRTTPRAAGGMARAIAAVAMGTLAVNGVGLAAGNASPPVAPVVISDPERGAAGPKGVPGEPGEPGKSGDPGSPGSPGKDGRVVRERGNLSVVYVEGPDLRPELERLALQVAASGQATRNVVSARSGEILGEVRSTSAGVSGVHSAVGNLDTFERVSWQEDVGARGRLASAVQQLDGTTQDVKIDVGVVRKTMEPAATNVSVAAADVLRTNAKPGGVVANLNPRNRYRVDGAVVATIERALPAPGSDAAGKAVLDALRTVQAGRSGSQRIGQFRHDLENAQGIKNSAAARELLRDLMPLILKVSRVPR